MNQSAPRGRFVWHELLTTGPEEAQAFYVPVLGWGTSVWEGGAFPYTMWTNDNVPLGGSMQLSDEAVAGGSPPHWLTYIATPDVDATIARAGELGAKTIVPPTDIPTVGRFCVMADPQGAIFAAFTPLGEAPGHDGPPERGEFSWHELATTDYEAALRFYVDLFGWEKTEAMGMGPMGTYQMFGQGGVSMGGMFNKPPDMPAPPHWLPYVDVDDVHRVSELVKQHGGQVLNGPLEVPGGNWIAQCMDPQGAAFDIHTAPAS